MKVAAAGLIPISPTIEVVPVVEIPDFARTAKLPADPRGTGDGPLGTGGGVGVGVGLGVQADTSVIASTIMIPIESQSIVFFIRNLLRITNGATYDGVR